jgi:hypothetical protein
MVKKIIIMASAGLVSFAGAFVFAWLTCPSVQDHPAATEQPVAVGGSPEQELSLPDNVITEAGDSASGPMKKALTEQQLKNLIQEVREKMRQYDNRLQTLTVEERRLQMAQDMLKEDINNLNNLRVELASTVANLKSERDKLLKSRLEIDQEEKVNLASIAATYDKMDASSAGKILANMCTVGGQTQNSQNAQTSGGYDDAIKILHYMTERTKAKLLAELAVSEPQLAAVLSQRLTQIVEKQ